MVRECLEALGIDVRVLSKLAEVDHAYSHFKVVLHVYACQLSKGRPTTNRPHAWVRIGELGKYPFPAANHKFFPRLKEYLDNL